MNNEQPWTEACDKRLGELWAAGLSVAQIGREMNRSKGSVSGRVHRTDLPARPSPIKAGAKPRAKAAPVLPRGRGCSVMTGATLEALGVVPAQDAPPPVPDAPVRLDPRHGCSWPIGEPRTKQFRYCDAPSLKGKSYCPAHHMQAVERVVRARTPAELAADEARRVAAHGRMARGGGTAMAMGSDWFAPGWAR
jgi:GcrA cell cycle regulator